MPTHRSSRWTSLVALVVYTAFVAYQTLAGGGAWECASPILAVPRRVPRSDAVANVIAYVPLGLLFVWATTRRWEPSSAIRIPPQRILATALMGVAATAALSACLELVQACQAHRVSSLYDLIANVVGGALGAAAAIVLRTATHGPDTPISLRLATREGRLRLLTIMVVVIWIVSQTMPWTFAVDVGTMRSNLSFLRRAWDGPALDGWRVLRHAGAWIAVAAACRLVGRNSRRSAVLLGLAGAASLLLQVLLDARAPLSSEELAGMALATMSMVVPMSLAGSSTSGWRWGLVLLTGALTAVVAYELRPEPGAPTQAFSWWPRVGLGGLLGALDYALFFGWLGLSAVVGAHWADADGDRHARRLWPAAVVLATLVLEGTQIWVPGRGPDVSAPVFTLLAVLLATAVLADGQQPTR